MGAAPWREGRDAIDRRPALLNGAAERVTARMVAPEQSYPASSGVDELLASAGVASGGEETSKAAALSLMRYGFARTATVDIEAASRLRADGSLCSSPEWRGEHEIGRCRAVRRNAIQGEHCVLVCSGDGSALYLLSALAERLSRRRRRAYGRPQPSR
jgi:hypothetical protein